MKSLSKIVKGWQLGVRQQLKIDTQYKKSKISVCPITAITAITDGASLFEAHFQVVADFCPFSSR
jgi:hypothetical protein